MQHRFDDYCEPLAPVIDVPLNSQTVIDKVSGENTQATIKYHEPYQYNAIDGHYTLSLGLDACI